MHGWIILDKPHGLGSTQAVSAVKRVLRQSGAGKVKVGHGGTLDPLATGVLPIAIGEATKLAGRMLDSDKIYDFTVALGVQTDTLDLEGKPVATSEHRPTWAQVEAVLPRFTGPIEQVPPAYSAILIDGQRAYDLARKGEAVEMKTRSVTIHQLQPDPGNMPDDPLTPIRELSLSAHVSKGTYIRSLARDIALALGTVGHVTMLRRVKAGPFTLESAISLDKLNDAATGHGIAQYMLPLTAGLDDIPALPVSPDEALALRQGKMLMGKPHTGLLLAMLGETPIALVESSGPEIRVVRGFNL
ncbi:tRNA pseudouridine(55) synthase TruB [Sphingobium naphthae]|uniref:tRNA pseudouridine synthase B n=1 Tax=Sphingobium naphthae TaxID=1886786 RepID=A0ABU3ZVD5_9SPHN|nr:tRNA pseudouridine(55) synthase TruB [Sphingobium naphthae]MDV5823481.1 tRNA pseudouridine(55) synthase TruB [Sphingobium naphthae]